MVNYVACARSVRVIIAVVILVLFPWAGENITDCVQLILQSLVLILKIADFVQ